MEVFAITLALALPVQAFTLATGGHAKAAIVVVAEATVAERAAAKDLAEYLRAISGAEFDLLTEGQHHSKVAGCVLGQRPLHWNLSESSRPARMLSPRPERGFAALRGTRVLPHISWGRRSTAI